MSKESDKTLAALRKEYGDSIGKKGGKFPPVPRIKTGIFPFDLATGGGAPRGRISEIYGLESSGKSLVLYKLICAVQAAGETAVLIDAENAFDDVWARAIGVDLDSLIVVQPDTAEQAVDAAEAFLYARDVALVGIDSVAALRPFNEIESEAGKMIVAGNAMLVTKLINKAAVAIGAGRKQERLPALVCLNQIRIKIGQQYGDPEITPGGNAFRFAAALRVRLYGKPVIPKGSKKPTSLEVSGICKKYKIPIVARQFEYAVNIIPEAGPVGLCAAWPTVRAYMRGLNLATKNAKGTAYICLGEPFKTLDAIEARYDEDEIFRDALQNAIIAGADKIKQTEDDESA